MESYFVLIDPVSSRLSVTASISLLIDVLWKWVKHMGRKAYMGLMLCQWAKLLSEMMAFHIGMLIWVLAVLLLIQLLASMHERTIEGGPGTWTKSLTQALWVKFRASVCSSDQREPLWSFGEWTSSFSTQWEVTNAIFLLSLHQMKSWSIKFYEAYWKQFYRIAESFACKINAINFI